MPPTSGRCVPRTAVLATLEDAIAILLLADPPARLSLSALCIFLPGSRSKLTHELVRRMHVSHKEGLSGSCHRNASVRLPFVGFCAPFGVPIRPLAYCLSGSSLLGRRAVYNPLNTSSRVPNVSSLARRPLGATVQSPRRVASASSPVRQHNAAEEPAMSKMAAEDRRVSAPPPGMFETAICWTSLRDTAPKEVASPRASIDDLAVTGGKRRCGRTGDFTSWAPSLRQRRD